MEILRSIDQLYHKIDDILGIKDQINLDAINFAGATCPPETLAKIANFAKNTPQNAEKFQTLADLIFQLNDYSALVCNLCHILLLAKRYDEIFVLTNKIFVAHFGQKPYNSKSATLPGQRSFDRLVEIVRVADIPNKIFVEFLVNIQQPPQKIYSIWKEPALEYLQNLFLDHENWLWDFVQKNPEMKYPTLGAILNFSTLKGVDFLVKDFIQNENPNQDEILSPLKDYKRETLHYIDNELPNAPLAQQLKMLEILLAMSSDSEVMTRIQDIYTTTKNPEVKNAISTKLAICDTINIRTEKQFLYAARRKIKEPQGRSLGVPFDKTPLHTVGGVETNDVVFSFIIYLFKEEKNLLHLYKLKMLENIFVKEELQNFVQKLFDALVQKGDILQAKWCVRMYALLSPSNALDQTFNLLTSLLNSDRTKEAKYLIYALIYSRKVEIIDFIKESLDEHQEIIKEELPKLIDTISVTQNLHKEDIKDMLVPSEFSIGEFDIQRDRLYGAFIAGKTYALPIFRKMFLQNKIYNKLAQNLVFGEYRGGRLYNAFIIKGTDIEFIVGRTIFEGNPDLDTEVSIGIIHPLDCDFKFDRIMNFFPNPTFNQFEPARFSTTDHAITATTVNRFVGMMINPQKFLQFVYSQGFRPNKHHEDETCDSIVHLFPMLNIIAEVEFQKPISANSHFGSLSKICFYKLSDTMQAQGKYLTQKTTALAISNLPNRYFNHILDIIYEGSKL